MKGVKNPIIRQRALMIIRALQTNNIKLAADTFGVSRQTYYFWVKRLRQKDYDLKALMNRSKAPKTNSRMVSEETIQLAIKVSTENYNIGPKNTAWFNPLKLDTIFLFFLNNFLHIAGASASLMPSVAS